MKHNEPVEMKNQEKEESQSLLEQIIKEGARKLLQAAIEHEVAEYITLFQDIKDENDRHMVVRNGFLPERSILTGIGPIPVKQPRVRDKREEEAFTSAILPRCLRRAETAESALDI